MSGPFRVEGGKTTGAVMSGSGNRQQFLDLFEQIFRYVEQHHTRAGIPLIKPPPKTAGAEAAEAAGGGGGVDDRWVGARVRLVVAACAFELWRRLIKIVGDFDSIETHHFGLFLLLSKRLRFDPKSLFPGFR